MRNILILIICFICFSCKNNEEVSKSIEEKITPNEIMLIFNNRTYAKDTLYFVGGPFSVNKNRPIFYTDPNTFDNVYIEPKNINESDTIKISTNIPISVNHKYHFYYDSSYLLHPGDTVIFDYYDDAPKVTFVNKKGLNNDYNFEANYNLSNPVYKGDVEFFYENNKKFRTDEDIKKYKKVLEYNIDNKISKLDSLYFSKTFSSKYYYFVNKGLLYKKKIIFSNYDLQEVDLQNDTLLLVQSYRHYLNRALYKHFEIKFSKTKPDYLALFDSIKVSQLFSDKIKDYLLYNNFKNIIKNYNQREIKNYFEDFKNVVVDTTFVRKISEDYFLEFLDLKAETENVNLISLSKERKTLDEIIKDYKGKIVYVDFWASWCAPCIKEMPASKEIIKEFGDQNVVVLYISIDNNFDDWESALKKLNMIYYKHSMLAINYPNATFFNNLNLQSIPRYLIFDEKGSLLHKNAPSPSSDEIEKILKNLIHVRDE
jgi:thiol-disulfide isomerase/thioredoxin